MGDEEDKLSSHTLGSRTREREREKERKNNNLATHLFPLIPYTGEVMKLSSSNLFETRIS